MKIDNESLQALFDKCKTINAVGIERLSLKEHDGNMVVSGIDDKHSVLVFDNIVSLIPEDLYVGILSLSTFINRLSLFDLSKVKATLDIREEKNWNEAVKLHLKQGNRKATYSFVPIQNTNTPNNVAEDTPVFDFELTKAYFSEIQSAIQSMRTSNKGADGWKLQHVPDEGVYLKFDDGVSDTFQELVADSDAQESGSAWTYCWQTKSVETVIRESLKNGEEKETTFVVCEKGLGRVTANGLTLTVLPYVEK